MISQQAIKNGIGVIVLGVASSGVWELVKPLLGKVWDAALTVATLGLDSLRDGIYLDAVEFSMGGSIGVQKVIFGSSVVSLIVGIILLKALGSASIGTATARRYLNFELILLGMIVALTVATTRANYVISLVKYYGKLEASLAAIAPDPVVRKLRAEYVLISNRDAYIKHIEKVSALIREAGCAPIKREFF